MPTSANADLARAINESFRTVASVNSQRASQQCIESATNYWLQTYRQSNWTIVTVDLTLLTNIIRSHGPNHIATKDLGVLNRSTLQGYDETNSLFIYSTDKYTENWVHEIVTSLALCNPKSNRVLNVQREDKGPILDLGPLT